MLDAKVLAAVFASLTAIATAMNGGSFQPDMAVDGVSAGLSDVPDFGGSSSTIDKIRDLFTSRPEPTNNVEATLTISDLDNEKMNLEKSTVRTSNLTEVNLGSKKMSSDENIVFNGLGGSMNLGDPIVLKGNANSITSSGVNVSGTFNLNQEINSSRIVIEEKGRAKISFSDVEADITYENKSEQTLSTEQFKIDSFSGRTTIYPGNSTVILDGKVNSLTAGEFSYGG